MRGRDGDMLSRDAFLRLIEQHTPVLLKVTSALVGFADAEDAAQEAVLRAWQARASLRDPDALRPWLMQIAVNVCRGWRRGRFGRERRHEQPLTAETRELLATLEADPGTLSHAAALDLRQAINALDAELRLVVVLRYYAGLDATAIGLIASVPPATIRTRLRRALTLLRERLRDSGHLPSAPSREGAPHD
ncbi:MAG TPA: sigma-70 family RNA polymerase sigma factor [Ktedonobacterales bacterium]